MIPASGEGDALTAIFGGIQDVAGAVQRGTNQWAALQAQNADIAGGRWTLNNAAYQYGQLSPGAQAAVLAALAYVGVKVLARVLP